VGRGAGSEFLQTVSQYSDAGPSSIIRALSFGAIDVPGWHGLQAGSTKLIDGVSLVWIGRTIVTEWRHCGRLTNSNRFPFCIDVPCQLRVAGKVSRARCAVNAPRCEAMSVKRLRDASECGLLD
jgi:hypothetical protein